MPSPTRPLLSLMMYSKGPCPTILSYMSSTRTLFSPPVHPHSKRRRVVYTMLQRGYATAAKTTPPPPSSKPVPKGGQTFPDGEPRTSAVQFVKMKSACKAVGIVGLPNVGKSTLFNALTSTQLAQAANYPFCTIEPNVGKVAVPDEKLDLLAKLGKAAKTTYAQIEFVDIAGLVKGAADGLGLGNKFLANIRQVSLIVQLLRCYEDDTIQHVEKTIDPVRDMDIINTELLLADLQTVSRMHTELQRKRIDPKNSEMVTKFNVVERTLKLLEAGFPARDTFISENEWIAFRDMHLLTAKPIIYACNVSEADVNTGNNHTQAVAKSLASSNDPPPILISAKIEEELANLDNDEAKQEFLSMYGMTSYGLKKIITTSRELTGLSCYYTVGPTEARSWTIPRGATARQAAGEIHSDFEKGFIKADTMAYDDYVRTNGNENALRAEGKFRAEGAQYIVKDGDILLFKFSTQNLK